MFESNYLTQSELKADHVAGILACAAGMPVAIRGLWDSGAMMLDQKLVSHTKSDIGQIVREYIHGEPNFAGTTPKALQIWRERFSPLNHEMKVGYSSQFQLPTILERAQEACHQNRVARDEAVRLGELGRKLRPLVNEETEKAYNAYRAAALDGLPDTKFKPEYVRIQQDLLSNPNQLLDRRHFDSGYLDKVIAEKRVFPSGSKAALDLREYLDVKKGVSDAARLPELESALARHLEEAELKLAHRDKLYKHFKELQVLEKEIPHYGYFEVNAKPLHNLTEYYSLLEEKYAAARVNFCGNQFRGLAKYAALGASFCAGGMAVDRITAGLREREYGRYTPMQFMLDAVASPQLVMADLPLKVKVPAALGAFALSRAMAYFG